jgi:hypothetical protein
MRVTFNPQPPPNPIEGSDRIAYPFDGAQQEERSRTLAISRHTPISVIVLT